jgi:hypothetical protein
MIGVKTVTYIPGFYRKEAYRQYYRSIIYPTNGKNLELIRIYRTKDEEDEDIHLEGQNAA